MASLNPIITIVRDFGRLSAADAGTAVQSQGVLMRRMVAERNATGLIDDMAKVHYSKPRSAAPLPLSIESMRSAAAAVQPERVLTPQQAAVQNMREITRSNLVRAERGVAPGATSRAPTRDLQDLWGEGGYAQTGRITARTPEQLVAATTRAEARALERALVKQAAADKASHSDWGQLMWDADHADTLNPLR